MTAEPKRASEWTIHGERVVADTRRAVLSLADVELPDGVRWELRGGYLDTDQNPVGAEVREVGQGR